MPQLPDNEPNVQQYYLPSTATLPKEDQAWVKIDLSPARTGDLLLYSDDDNMDARFMKWLVARLVSWNFTEKDNTLVPINWYSIQRLPKVDYHFLYEKHLEAIKEQNKPQLDTAEKKSSSSTLVG